MKIQKVEQIISNLCHVDTQFSRFVEEVANNKAWYDHQDRIEVGLKVLELYKKLESAFEAVEGARRLVPQFNDYGETTLQYKCLFMDEMNKLVKMVRRRLEANAQFIILLQIIMEHEGILPQPEELDGLFTDGFSAN